MCVYVHVCVGGGGWAGVRDLGTGRGVVAGFWCLLALAHSLREENAAPRAVEERPETTSFPNPARHAGGHERCRGSGGRLSGGPLSFILRRAASVQEGFGAALVLRAILNVSPFVKEGFLRRFAALSLERGYPWHFSADWSLRRCR